jgi:hypothetical protein
MNIKIDWIQRNRLASFLLSAIAGLLYYLAYQYCRLALIPFSGLLPPDIFYNRATGEIVSRVVTINLVETIVAAMPAAVLLPIALSHSVSRQDQIFWGNCYPHIWIGIFRDSILVSFVRLVRGPVLGKDLETRKAAIGNGSVLCGIVLYRQKK